MKKIDIDDYAGLITKELKRGILISTNADKYNSMVIGWGNIGTVWNRETFVCYVRDSRYTKGQLDKSGEFTVSVPLNGPDPVINRVCGVMSGRDVDKVKEVGMTVASPCVTGTPGILEYPLTLECRVLYSHKEAVSDILEDIQNKFYPERRAPGPDSSADPHTMYIGEIVSAYILEEQDV